MVALDSKPNVTILPPAVPRVGHSEVSRRAYVERRARYLRNLIISRGNLLKAGLTEPFHPILNLFRFLKVFPLCLGHLGPKTGAKRRGQRAHLRHTWVAHSNQQHRSTSLKRTVGCVHYPAKEPGLFHLVPEEAEMKWGRCWGVTRTNGTWQNQRRDLCFVWN